MIKLCFVLLLLCSAGCFAAPPRDIRELKPLATLKLGKTADWVVIGEDAVWVASSGPFAVHRIDPASNQVTDHVMLGGEACAGLALGFGKLWVPICAGKDPKQKAALTAVDLASRKVTAVYALGPAAPEGGITASDDSLWLVIDKRGALARIDPVTGLVRTTLHIAPGSYNPRYQDGVVWITQAQGSTLSRVDARTGEALAPIKVGAKPRFLTSSAEAVWTLNQGDGSVTRIDARSGETQRIALRTPGHGGDIQYAAGHVWSTMPKMPLSLIDANSGALLCQWQGPGGDSLGVGFGAVWLTDYYAGTVARISVQDALGHCLNKS